MTELITIVLGLVGYSVFGGITLAICARFDRCVRDNDEGLQGLIVLIWPLIAFVAIIVLPAVLAYRLVRGKKK